MLAIDVHTSRHQKWLATPAGKATIGSIFETDSESGFILNRLQ